LSENLVDLPFREGGQASEPLALFFGVSIEEVISFHSVDYAVDNVGFVALLKCFQGEETVDAPWIVEDFEHRSGQVRVVAPSQRPQGLVADTVGGRAERLTESWNPNVCRKRSERFYCAESFPLVLGVQLLKVEGNDIAAGVTGKLCEACLSAAIPELNEQGREATGFNTPQRGDHRLEAGRVQVAERGEANHRLGLCESFERWCSGWLALDQGDKQRQ